MMRGLTVAGPRPLPRVTAQINNFDIEDISRLGVQLLARSASGSGQRRFTHQKPDFRVASIDEQGAPRADGAATPDAARNIKDRGRSLRAAPGCVA